MCDTRDIHLILLELKDELCEWTKKNHPDALEVDDGLLKDDTSDTRESAS
jgi:hypothetical protein